MYLLDIKDLGDPNMMLNFIGTNYSPEQEGSKRHEINDGAFLNFPAE